MAAFMPVRYTECAHRVYRVSLHLLIVVEMGDFCLLFVKTEARPSFLTSVSYYSFIVLRMRVVTPFR